jgi:death-on-curing protein
MVAVFGIEDLLLAAEGVLGIDAERLINVTQIPLAESALAAPFAGVADRQFYEHPVQQAAVLASRIIRNHPLPDGNKRVALILMELHLEEHGYRLTAEPQEIDRMFRAVAARVHTRTTSARGFARVPRGSSLDRASRALPRLQNRP